MLQLSQEDAHCSFVSLEINEPRECDVKILFQQEFDWLQATACIGIVLH